MYQVRIIPHAEISQIELDEIIKIKMSAWPHPYDKQVTWIKNNLKQSDIHFSLLRENKIVAYLNLIPINLTIDNINYEAMGIGNVCAIEKKKGYGSELIKISNQFLVEENKIGLLFCKYELVNFYKKLNWILIEKSLINMTLDNDNFETLIFNYNFSINNLTYFGQAF